MATTSDQDVWKELLRECPVTPLDTNGREMEPDTLSPGNQLAVLEERGDRLLLKARGTAKESEWQYLVSRAAFALALTPPGDLPRSGQAPSEASALSGSPD